MKYFGVPTCPYCRKRVNLVRTWSLKRQGEYQCPRCGGISNIYLSPLIYVLALLAVFAGGVMYFFHKFVLDDVTLKTALYVFLPFAVFFLFSLFMVYLEKPVIKKVSRAEYEKKRLFRSKSEEAPATNPPPGPEYQQYFEEDYVPRNHYKPGPSPQAEPGSQQGVVNQQAFSRAKQRAEVENSQRVRLPAARPAPSAASRPQPRPAAPRQAQPAPYRPATQATPAAPPRTPAVGGSVRQQAGFAQQGTAMQHRAAQQGVRPTRPPQPRGGTGTTGANGRGNLS